MQITTVLLNNFVKYTYKIIYGYDKRKLYEMGKSLFPLFFFPINIPITKCVAYEDCTTEILSLKNYLYTLTNYIITFS